jgi:hypothetical protein
MFELITTFYKEKNEIRRNEFIQALVHNISNTLVKSVYVLCESGEEFITHLSSKIVVIQQNSRPRFADLIKFSNNLNQNSFKIIANTDIYFDKTLQKALSIKKNQVYCLDENNVKYYANFKSQDAWIYRGNLPEDIGDYFMGLPGCDNRLAYELKSKGYQLLNPSFSIQAIHIHRTNLRNYSKIIDKVNGKYYYPLPIGLNQLKVKNDKLIYLLIRRKYFSAIVSKSLEGFDYTIWGTMIARILEIYYKFQIKANG